MPNEIFEWAKIEPRTVIAGFHGRFVHSDTMTFALWQIDAGATCPSIRIFTSRSCICTKASSR